MLELVFRRTAQFSPARKIELGFLPRSSLAIAWDTVAARKKKRPARNQALALVENKQVLPGPATNTVYVLILVDY